MDIYLQNSIFIEDVVITQPAEHEEELMKSDFIRLSWDAATKTVIPSDAYIIPYPAILDRDGQPTKYSLLEPYEPEQKGGDMWHYEPLFHHPKMYLGKATFKHPTKDSNEADIVLLDWSFTGSVKILLGYFCDAINDIYGFDSDEEKFSFAIIPPIKETISVNFSTTDILSALSQCASTMECEWHIDWEQRTLFFGHIKLDRLEPSALTLRVGDNIGLPSVRSSKEGYWNAFEPQGSSRNITRRAASGEYVQSKVRLALDKTAYPDGIIYSLGELDAQQRIITYNKTQFDLLHPGVRTYVKSLIMEEVYPRLNLYVYDVRCRERYQLDEQTKEKVVDYYDTDNKPVYKRYAVWFIRLAYYNTSPDGCLRYSDAEDLPDGKHAGDPVTFDEDGTTYYWHDFRIKDEVTAKVVAVSGNAVSFDLPFLQNMFTEPAQSGGYPCVIRHNGNDYSVIVYNADGKCLVSNSQLAGDAATGDLVQFLGGVDPTAVSSEFKNSQIIDGKTVMCAFQANTAEGAETSPLAGMGDGDGSGTYGFGVNFRTEDKTIDPNTDGEGDTGVIIKNGDFEIVLQQDDDYIIPTTAQKGLVPKGKSYASRLGNIVNLYNIVMSPEYESTAQSELEAETKKSIDKAFRDNDEYTFKGDANVFAESKPSLYIGRSVTYDNGQGYTLDTRIMKLVTKIDYDFEVEITVGNEVLKGNQTTMKEQVDTLVSYVSNNGGGLSSSQVRTLVENWATPRFLSKINADTAQGVITFLQGLRVGNRFVSGLLGEGGIFNKDADGKTYIEADKMYIRMKAYFDTVEIRKFLHSNGNRIASDAGCKCIRVEGLDNSGNVTETTANIVKYRCYFRGSDGDDTVTNDFAIGDQAYCKVSNVASSSSLYQHEYWRLVVGKSSAVNADGEHYIDLSNRASETIGGIVYSGYMQDSDAPVAQDDIIQLGNVNDADRRGAIIEFVAGNDAPSYQIFQDLGSIGTASTIAEKQAAQYSLVNRNYIGFGYKSQSGRAYMNVYGDFYFGDMPVSPATVGNSYIRYDSALRQLDIKARISAQSTIGGDSIEQYIHDHQNNYDDSWIQPALDELQNQLDGAIDTWFYDYMPVATDVHGAPANRIPLTDKEPYRTWYQADHGGTAQETTTERTKHLGDIFYDNTSGYAFRFSLNEGTSAFEWVEITDSAVIKALNDAAKAQDTADHKRRIFVLPVTIDGTTYNYPYPPYDKGDLWVNATYPSGYSGNTDESQHKYRNDVLKCVTSKGESGAFSINDWTLASKYTDDTTVNAIIQQYGSILNIQTPTAENVGQALGYLREVLGGSTSIDGGLVLTNAIYMRDNPVAPSTALVWAGITGMYRSAETGTGWKGHGTAAWYGGGVSDGVPVDKETLSATEISQGWSTFRWARSLFRFDGSGYVADGSLSWDNAGGLTIKNVTWGDDDIRNFFNAFAVGVQSSRLTITPKGDFSLLNVLGDLKVGGTLVYNETTHTATITGGSLVATRDWVGQNYVSKAFFNAIFQLEDSNGNVIMPNNATTAKDRLKILVGAYTDQYLSALGLNSEGGGGGATTLYALLDVKANDGNTGVYGAADGYVLTYNATEQRWYAADGLNITKLAQYLTQNGYATQTWVQSQGYLTQHQSLAEYQKYANYKTLTIKSGNTNIVVYKPSVSADLTLGFVAGTNISLTPDTTNNTITIANTYTHPTGGANTTITAANGKVLSAITVNNLGHVTSVSSKTLAAADIPGLDWSKITSGKPTTLAGYGITDAKIASGVITLGSNTITPVTSVAMTMPTGFTVTGSPISKTGTLAVSYTNGYEGFTTILKDRINALYSWFEVDANGNVRTKDWDDQGTTKHRGFYSYSFVSALGQSDSSGGGGMDVDMLWSVLQDNYDGEHTIDSRYINFPADTGMTSVEVTGSGNAVTTASYSSETKKLTLTKGTTFLTQHQSLAAYTKTADYKSLIIQGDGTSIGTYSPTSALTVNFIAGSNISITRGTNTLTIANTYTLPTASSSTLGGIKVGDTLAISSSVLNLVEVLAAGTAGQSTASSGYQLSVPYVTYDKYGRITVAGTHTHTVNSIPNSSLANSSVTVNGTSVSLGGSVTTAKWGTARNLWGRSVDGSGDISGHILPSNIEFTVSATAGNGGYLDFHFNNSNADYTSRIIEDASGRIQINAEVYIPSGKRLRIGDIYIGYDPDNNALKVYKVSNGSEVAANFYALGAVSALGMSGSSGGGGGIDYAAMWSALTDSSDSDASHYIDKHFLNTLSNLTLNVYSGTSTPSATSYNGQSTASVNVAGNTAITGISRSGTTFTATRANGTTFTFTQQDNNTWKPATTSQEGYAPKLALASSATIDTQASDYVLTYKAGTETAPVWRKLPANAFLNNTYTVNNAKLDLQANGTSKVKFYANDGTDRTFNIAQGSANGTISVGGTDVAVKGLAALAYKASVTLDEVADGSTRKLANYLPLAGGTMTGNLYHKLSTLERGVRPASDEVRALSVVYDKNNKIVGRFDFAGRINGRDEYQILVSTNTSASTSDEYGGFRIYKVQGATGSKVMEFNANSGDLNIPNKFTAIGGTISPSSINDVIIRKTGNSSSVIRFDGKINDANTILGYFGFNAVNQPIFTKADISATYKLWHEGNDGAGSTLDADLLDGQHGSYYATAASLNNYLLLTGGTMTGDISRKMTTLTRGTAPSANTYGALIFKDKDNKTLGKFEYGSRTNNTVQMNVWLLNPSLETDAYSGLTIKRTLANTNNASLIFDANTGLLETTSLKIGSIYLEEVDGNLRVSKRSGSSVTAANLYATGAVSALGLSSSSGGGGGDATYEGMWSDLSLYRVVEGHNIAPQYIRGGLFNSISFIESGKIQFSGAGVEPVVLNLNHTHAFNELTGKPTTIAGYGITDAKIQNGVITLGNNTITPITSLTGYATEAWTYGRFQETPTIFVGTCTTAAGTQAKVATVTQIDANANKFRLVKGVIVAIKFSYSNTYNVTDADHKITLNVNNTGAKTIYYSTSNANTGTNTNAYGVANRYVYYMYDGSQWIWLSHGTDNNSDTKIRIYRQTSGYNAEYPLLVSRTVAGSIGTVGTDSSFTDCYAVMWNDAAKIPTLNPSTGTLTALNYKTKTLSGHYPAVSFYQVDTHWGHIGFSAKDVPSVYYPTDNVWKEIITAKNIGSQTVAYATLFQKMSNTASTSRSTWAIPEGGVQVFGQLWSDSALKYTPSGGSETAVTDSGHWVMWLSGTGTTNSAALNMKIDGTYYGNFSGNIYLKNHTANDVNYPIIWGNQANANNTNADFYKSYPHLYYNPSKKLLYVEGRINVGGKVQLRKDDEGGNLTISCPDSTDRNYIRYTDTAGTTAINSWEMDAYNGNLRIWTYLLNGNATTADSLSTIISLNRYGDLSAYRSITAERGSIVAGGSSKTGEHQAKVYSKQSGDLYLFANDSGKGLFTANVGNGQTAKARSILSVSPNNADIWMRSDYNWTKYYCSSDTISARLTNFDFNFKSGATGRDIMRLDMLVGTSSATSVLPPNTPTGQNPAGHVLSFGWDGNENVVSQLYVPAGDRIGGTYGRQMMYLRGNNNSASDWKSWFGIPYADGVGATGTWGISITGNADTVDSWHAIGVDASNYYLIKQGFVNCPKTDASPYSNEQWFRIATILGSSSSANRNAYLLINDAMLNRWYFVRIAMRQVNESTDWTKVFQVIATNGDPAYVRMYYNQLTDPYEIWVRTLPTSTGNKTIHTKVIGEFQRSLQYSKYIVLDNISDGQYVVRTLPNTPCISGDTKWSNLQVPSDLVLASENGTYIQIGAIKLQYDSTNNAIKVVKSDGTAANFYATGAVSAFGSSSSSGGGGGIDYTAMWSALTDDTDSDSTHYISKQFLSKLSNLTLYVYNGTSLSASTVYNGQTAQSVSVAGTNAITGITRSGTTFTATRADGTTFTFTQQDTTTTTGSMEDKKAGILYIVGAKLQALSATTFTNKGAYIDSDGYLYSGSEKVLTSHQSLANYVTLNTTQVISGIKQFTGALTFSGNNGFSGNNTFTGHNTNKMPEVKVMTGSGTAAQDKGSGVSNRYCPALWTFNTGAAPSDGDVIYIKIPVAGHDYGVWLSTDNGTTYKPISLINNGRLTTHFAVNRRISLVYEADGATDSVFNYSGGDARINVTGGCWRVINYYDANNYHSFCTTASGTAAKVANATNFVLRTYCTFHLYLSNANTYAGKITLNVNNTGAKDVYINGAVSSATNYTLPAGSYFVYYNGAAFSLRTDGKIPVTITGSAGSLDGGYISFKSTTPSFLYKNSKTFENATTPTGDWCVRIKLDTHWNHLLTNLVIIADYSNRRGTLYLDLDAASTLFRYYHTNYSGSNILAIKRYHDTDGGTQWIYVKLAKPTTYSGSLPKGKISVFSPVSFVDAGIEVVEAPSDLIPLDYGYGANTPITTTHHMSASSFEFQGMATNANNGGFIDFHYNNSSADYTSRIIEEASGRLNINYSLYVNKSGNVGIGTSSPSYKLHVSGTTYISGATTLNSTLSVVGPVSIPAGTYNTLKLYYGTVNGENKDMRQSSSSSLYLDFYDGSLGNANGICIEGSGITMYSGSDNDYVFRIVSGGDATDQYLTLDTDGALWTLEGVYTNGYVSALGQNSSSDIRMKNVKDYDAVVPVDVIAAAPAIHYTWKDKRETGLRVGSIAQYWQQLLPEAIHEDKDGMLSMEYGVIALLASIANARKVVDHERRIKELEKENERLRTEVELLKIK